MNGKGSMQRPGNLESYRLNYDRIFERVDDESPNNEKGTSNEKKRSHKRR